MGIRLTIIDPVDPLGNKVAGTKTFIRGLIEHAPADFDLEFIGVTSDRSAREPGRWATIHIGKRRIEFYPLLHVKDENRKRAIPLTLRFSFALMLTKFDFENRVILFNTIEPAVRFGSTGPPKMVVIHNDICGQILSGSSEMLWSRIPRIYSLFERHVFHRLDAIYTVSSKTLDYYRSRYPDYGGKVHFVPTWVDPRTFSPLDRSKTELREEISFDESTWIPPESRWILFVGRLQKQKAPSRLVDAFCEYCGKDGNASLIVIGDGNLREDTERYARLRNMGDRAHFLGSMDQGRLARYYRASDVLLLTSDFEGMPMCVLEALGCGLPVVSTNVGDVKRVVMNGFSGELAEGFSPDAIAAALEKVTVNPGAYTRGNCLEAVSEYTPDKVFRPLYEHMRAVCRTGRLAGT